MQQVAESPVREEGTRFVRPERLSRLERMASRPDFRTRLAQNFSALVQHKNISAEDLKAKTGLTDEDLTNVYLGLPANTARLPILAKRLGFDIFTLFTEDITRKLQR